MGLFFEQSYYARRSDKATSNKVTAALVSEVLQIAVRETGKKASELVVLDCGSGSGEYSLALAKKVKRVVGVEPYKEMYQAAVHKKGSSKRNVVFKNCLIEDYQTKEKYDLILSLTTIEHMPNVESSFSKLHELLADRGIVYVTAPNKYWPYEHHYRLWFLSWLPLNLANSYVRLMKRGESYMDSAYALSYRGMMNLFTKCKFSYQFVLPSIDSSYIGCGEESSSYLFLKNMGIRAIRYFPFLWTFSKGFIVVLKKKVQNPFEREMLYHYKLAFDKLCELPKELIMLDYGSGEGNFIGKLSPISNNLFGFEVDSKKVRTARKKYPDVNFQEGNTNGLVKYKSGSFDIVFLFHVLEHVESEGTTLDEIHRVLKDDGFLFLSSPYNGLFAWADMANLRYQIPWLHKVLGNIYFGKKKYKQLFSENKSIKLYGDLSVYRHEHHHYTEKEIKKLLGGRFRTIQFDKYSLFQPFLLDLYNIWRFLFKGNAEWVKSLIYFDNKINAGNNSYNFFLLAKKNA